MLEPFFSAYPEVVNEREKLFEGSTYTKPTVRTHEEIIAKYRNTGVIFRLQIGLCVRLKA